MTILDEIVETKRGELSTVKRKTPLATLKLRVAERPAARLFKKALRGPGVSLIAEAKKASPSKGLLCPDFDPVELAKTYEKAGAAAISVLTEKDYFQGSLDYLTAVKEAVHIPVLRKDFVFDPYQVYEAAAAGADALLLIVAILDDGQLKKLYELATNLGIACLVEVHDESELTRAANAGAGIIGINNRDLATFKVDLGVTERLAAKAPAGTVIVSESGIKTKDDIQRLKEHGVDAVLVGETLVTSGDISKTVRDLFHDQD